MTRIAKFYTDSDRADAVDEAGIPKLPMQLQDVVDFFNSAQRTTDDKQASYQTLNSYVSAIKHYYKEASIADEALYAFIKTMLEGVLEGGDWDFVALLVLSLIIICIGHRHHVQS
jgi:hypothetical protein